MASLSEQLALDEEAYVALLTKLIGESKNVQNAPPKLVPREDLVIRHLLDVLTPLTTANGGPLVVQHVTFKEGRGNLLLEYNPKNLTECVTFAGSHLDVVPANPEDWTVNPFELKRDGDKLYGRGTTDCLGHVAVLTELFRKLGTTKPDLKVGVFAVFIASEENSSIPEVGVEMLMRHGYMDKLKAGPVYWVDSADSQPCIGTAAAIGWKLRVEGRLFHSGLPHLGINSLELANSAVAELQRRFYTDFPNHAEEKRYSFATPSTMKPTKLAMSDNSVNQIPPWVEVSGDIRLTPFYNPDDCVKKMSAHVEHLNSHIQYLPTHGPCSKYTLNLDDGQVFRGKLTWTIEGDIFKGIACKLDSKGYKALLDATEAVKGAVKPYSICGSLPLVGDMQSAGFDVQISGYGKSSVYHGLDEYCLLSDMVDATKIFALIIEKMSASVGK